MYRGRFAPTPSGELHLGSLVTAVASYLDARAHGGEWLVRIEDVDTQRCKRHFESSLLFELERHGLHWDGPVVRQSERFDFYLSSLATLASAGCVYLCSCSRASLMRRGCPLNSEGEFIYPNYCRPLVLAPFDSKLLFDGNGAIRFSVADEQITFHDRRFGECHASVRELVGDFVLRRADGCFSYHLVVVLDDYSQGITDVVRGFDILPLTARHIALQRAFSFPTPRYLHIPLVYSKSGGKLSKSASAQALRATDASENLLSALKHLDLEIAEFEGMDCEAILAAAVQAWNDKLFYNS